MQTLCFVRSFHCLLSIQKANKPFPDLANADHAAAAEAIARGLGGRSAEQGAGYWVHTSGTGVLCGDDIEKKSFGSASSKFYSDDDEGVGKVTSLPDSAPHRGIDKIVLEASAANPHIKTAIVAPSTIYGQGQGPGNQRSLQLPELARFILQRKEGFHIGAGLNRWMSVHIADLSKLYLRLVEEALKPDGGVATWGARGYYFVENGIFVCPPFLLPLDHKRISS